MRKITTMLIAAIAAGLIVLFMGGGSPVWAQVQRTFVSSIGNDNNSCTRTAPCKTLQTGVNKVAAGGEVVPLDSAEYGTLFINKTVTISAPPGITAIVTNGASDGVDINAGPSDVIVLRGLTLTNGNAGILFNSGGSLHVDECVIEGFSQDGITFGGPGSLYVTDSIVRNNQLNGINVFSTSQVATAVIDRVTLEDNFFDGLAIGAGVKGLARNSVAAGNQHGMSAVSFGTGNTAELTVEKCLIANNGGGVTAQGNNGGLAILRISGSTVTDNSSGLAQSANSVLLSRGNNTVEGNTINTIGTIGSFTAK